MKKIKGGFSKNFKKVIGLSLVTAMAITSLPSSLSSAFAAEGQALKDKYTEFDGRDIDWKYSVGENVLTYSKTKENYAGVKAAEKEINVDLSSLSNINGRLKTSEYDGRTVILNDLDGEYIEFKINVPEDAIYGFEIDYHMAGTDSSSAKRNLFIDGEYPFTEAADLVFYRYFCDDGEPILNSIGDETRPRQKEITGWRTQGLKDTTGISSEDYRIFLTKGSHTVKFMVSGGDMYISGIRFTVPEILKTYAEVEAEYKANGYKNVDCEKITFQAETTAIEKNSTTLRRENDGDPLVEPVSGTSRRLNVIGGSKWRYGNQSITWEFEVPEDGLYKIGLYEKQAWNDGLPSYRQILIDGKVPFEELSAYKFEFTGGTKWIVNQLGPEDGDPYRFYLTKGKHTITMTVKMGNFGPIIESLKQDITVLSDVILNITMIAGASPDPNYDYGFFEKIPDLEEDLNYLIDSLQYKYELANSMSKKTSAMANNFLAVQEDIKAMVEDPFVIAKRFSLLEDNQNKLSEYYQTIQYLMLVVDEFYVGSPDEEWKSVSSNFFQRFGVTIQQFLLSFTKDYDNIGSVLTENTVVTDTIDVWIARSTEYAEIIKQLADETFTPESGIAINVNVLPSSQLDAGQVNAIMLAITSGKAPDVALGVDIKSPVEFAIRDQVYDLSKMDGFKEMQGNFVEAIFTPYKYQGGIYAIPETMNFNVLFYRKDILAKFGIDLPDTWDDLYEYVLPALYQNGLEFYFAREFSQFLFQNGGEYYTEDGLRSALDTPEAYKAFKEYTELFTNYGVDKTANFYQYFRSGLMPLGVGDFNAFMQLSAAAPELAGKWGIVSLPGHLKADGTIDRTAGAITQTGDVILKQSEKPEQSWEFLKWWTSTETQTQFAKEVEATIGTEARWNTANKEAFLKLSWSREDIAALQEEWKFAKETPYVLGGYMTERHLTNAWTSVVMSGMDVREAIERAVKDINRELRMKQEEYGVNTNE
ncbi:MAG: extracellular solute-binding protein [Lachnospiraceae bacterium]|nr:extracellular solute-binding protein [Lachnospiraceae bacterium]